ncbi:MAG: WD40 repeat domain-containing protein [Pirellulaceae bacterium]|nr:WD40 repeat domain-containing protein [Pirellulaceae bacterium]
MEVDSAKQNPPGHSRFELLQIFLVIHALAGALFVLHILVDGARTSVSAPPILALSDDGSSCVAAVGNHTWLYRSSGELLADWRIHAISATFAPDSRRVGILSDSAYGVHVFDLATRERMAQFDAFRFAFSPDGHSIALLALDNTMATRLEICELVAQRVERTLTPFTPPVSNYVHTDILRYSPDGSMLAVGGSDYSTFDYQLLILNAETDATISQLAGDMAIDGLHFSPDGRQFAIATAGGGAGHFEIRDTQSKQVLATISEAKNILSSFAYDGQQVALAWDKHLELWDVAASPRLLFHVESTADIEAVAFATSAPQIVTAESDGSLYWRDRNRGNVLRRIDLPEASAAIQGRKTAPWRNTLLGTAGWIGTWVVLWIFVGRRPMLPATSSRFNRWLILAVVGYEALNALPFGFPLFMSSMNNAMLLALHLVVLITFVLTGISWHLMRIRFHLPTFLERISKLVFAS